MNELRIEQNRFLKQNVEGFCHTDFYGYGKPNNPTYLNILKNDFHQSWSEGQLKESANKVRDILLTDFPRIFELSKTNPLTVCVVPRAKPDNTYSPNQLLFKSTVQSVVNELDGLVDGTEYITRHTNTRTTHLRRPVPGWTNDGDQPYPGITARTCNISNEVNNKDILLVDDIYTPSVNIDEDAIQALINEGANSVIFYAVARTVNN